MPRLWAKVCDQETVPTVVSGATQHLDQLGLGPAD